MNAIGGPVHQWLHLIASHINSSTTAAQTSANLIAIYCGEYQSTHMYL
jgi:hypothetical protein